MVFPPGRLRDRRPLRRFYRPNLTQDLASGPRRYLGSTNVTRRRRRWSNPSLQGRGRWGPLAIALVADEERRPDDEKDDKHRGDNHQVDEGWIQHHPGGPGRP